MPNAAANRPTRKAAQAGHLERERVRRAWHVTMFVEARVGCADEGSASVANDVLRASAHPTN